MVEQDSMISHLYFRLGVPAILARLLVTCLAGHRINVRLYPSEPWLGEAVLPYLPERFNFISVTAPVQAEAGVWAVERAVPSGNVIHTAASL
jgi:hypothetical protein